MGKDRVIAHSDMNGFYASVELLYRPELRDKPVAVVGDTEQRHGIILARNQIAKKYHLVTGEAIWLARQKCRDLVTLPANYDRYRQFSKLARKIYQRYTNQVEFYGLDEAWLDLTGSVGLFGTGSEIADELRAVIKTELGITASVGIAWNKIFAKVGSDYKKPDYTTSITRQNYKEIVWPLPVDDLLYVGRANGKKLHGWGIHTIGQLAQTNPDILRPEFHKWGDYLWAFANGHDVSPVLEQDHESAIKSIGNSMTTYRDIRDYNEAWQVFLSLSESVAKRLRENGFYARTVQISVRDSSLIWFERQAKLEVPACTVTAIAEAAMRLLRANYNFSSPLRSLGVRACDLVDSSVGYQLCIWGNNFKLARLEKMESAVDDLRRRFGRDSIVRAALVGADIVRESDPQTHDVHPFGFFGR